ncbi:MAG TPA: methylenetetrahydrofolate reductase [NAD(P)H] [Caulobacteraceae bacterium]|nr:methylenetetrahydrofolate reductase [NAD(P)H] [Caulobacteraceae bacterium]
MIAPLQAESAATSGWGPVARAGDRAPRRLNVSFEFSPPRTPEAEEGLWRAIRRLEPLGAAFVSVTYGAGGSTRERTHRTVTRILRETRLKPAAHLTCVEAERFEVDEVARAYWDGGVRHIVALRGDLPGVIGGSYPPRPDGYANATELVLALRRIAPFEIAVGAYPQGHPESPSLAHDIEVLKAKADAGATSAITQFFFDVDGFLRFADQVRKAGVDIRLVPGIMPISNFAGLRRMARPCGVDVPTWLANLFEGLDEDPGTRRLVAASVAAEMCARLEEEGFADFHIYTLNRAELTLAICQVLGVRAEAAQ